MSAFTPWRRITLCIVWASFSLRHIVNGYMVLPSTALQRPRSFSGLSSADRPRTTSTTIVCRNSNRWNEEIDENSRRKASGGGGETFAGAVLGGLLGGPFGAVFGASVGSSFGARAAQDRARQEEMKRLGLSQDMLDSAQEVGLALEQCMQGLSQVQENLETQQRLARRLDADSETLYDKAKTAMAENNEDTARDLLMQREKVRDRLKQVLENCVKARNQVDKMEANAAELEGRAMEIEALLQRTVGAKAMQNTEDLGLSLRDSDPLLQKFKDMGID